MTRIVILYSLSRSCTINRSIRLLSIPGRIGCMLPNNRLGAVVLMSLVAAIVLLIALGGKPATAQDQSVRGMHGLLESLTSSGTSITILFDQPLVSGEGVWT